MILLSALIGQEAIALGTATKNGTVTSVATAADLIVAVGLSDRSIRADAVRSFEGDVLTYDESSADVQTDCSDPRGRTVLDTSGDAHGTLTDLQIAEDGRIETLVMNDGTTIEGNRLLAIGDYVVVSRVGNLASLPA